VTLSFFLLFFLVFPTVFVVYLSKREKKRKSAHGRYMQSLREIRPLLMMDDNYGCLIPVRERKMLDGILVLPWFISANRLTSSLYMDCFCIHIQRRKKKEEKQLESIQNSALSSVVQFHFLLLLFLSPTHIDIQTT
jgi:preprotein translocase subunit YajC